MAKSPKLWRVKLARPFFWAGNLIAGNRMEDELRRELIFARCQVTNLILANRSLQAKLRLKVSPPGPMGGAD